MIDALRAVVNDPQTLLAQYYDGDGVPGTQATAWVANLQSLLWSINLQCSRTCNGGDFTEAGTFRLVTSNGTHYLTLIHGKRSYSDGTVEDGMFYKGVSSMVHALMPMDHLGIIYASLNIERKRIFSTILEISQDIFIGYLG